MDASLATPANANANAAATATAPRLDLYTTVHKALRNFMSDTLVRLGRMDAEDEADLQQALQQVEALLNVCTAHVQHENEFVHPAIEARAPTSSRRIASEHDEHLESLAELRNEVAALRSARISDRSIRALRLYRHLALFVAASLQHMHIEESAHNAVLWANYSDAELLQVHQRLLASIDPREMLLVMRWMLPALTPTERVAVVAGMQAGAPPEAFLGLLMFVRPYLEACAWEHLTRAVGVSPPPAPRT